MTPQPNQLPVALITGAATRLGADIARALAGSGYAVVIHHRSRDTEAAALVAEIENDGGIAAAIKADLANRRQRASLVGRAGKPFGPLSVLINNASSFAPDGVTDLDETLWDRHFAVHLEAPAFLSRDFAAQLRAGEQGNVVNIVDERVLRLTPNYFSYTLSKAALWTMTQTLAQSLAPRVRVNAIGPGPIIAEAGQTPAAFRRSRQSAPLGYGGTPSDVTEALLFLLNAPSVTGQMIAIDGGRHLDFPSKRGPTPRRPK
ncbi:MAG: SDR family oxidoreductase [Devosia sp.]